MSAKLDEAKDDLLRRAAEVCAHTSGSRGGGPEQTASFLRLYYRRVDAEDLRGRDPVNVYGPALSHRQLGEERPEGRALVRVYTPTVDEYGWDPGHTMVEIVTDDMPYLVDSVTMEIERHDIDVHWVVHPQIGVTRDITGTLQSTGEPFEKPGAQEHNESWMHFEIDRQTDPAVLRQLEGDLQRILGDVRSADEDTAKMTQIARDISGRLADKGAPVTEGEVADGVELLRWLADGNFVFVGYREYNLETSDDGDRLKAVPGTGLGVLRHDKEGSDSFAALPPQVRARARDAELLILTKANTRSTVHRPHYLDYVGVKTFDDKGEVVGEKRFLGLYTLAAYSGSITEIPVLKRKLTEVLDGAGVDPNSYDGKELTATLETYPRDELFQAPSAELLPVVLNVLRLRERKQVRLFLRRDVYDRFMSCLVFLPRDRYNTNVRLRIEKVLREAFDAASIDYRTNVSESSLARLYFVVRGARGRPIPEVDTAELEAAVVAATRSWDDDLTSAITEQFGEETAARVQRRYAHAFPDGFKADFPARTAVADIRRLEELDRTADGDTTEVAMNLYEPYEAAAGERRLKIYRVGAPISLSGALPLLQRMGVEVVDEHPYEINRAGAAGSGRAWIYDFGLRYETATVDAQGTRELFQDALAALWYGKAENDGFSALVLTAGMSWQQVVVLRAYAKFLRQSGTTFSQGYVERVLNANPKIARKLVQLFESRFDPRFGAAREERCEALAEEVRGELDDVASLDEDRILRSYLTMILATLRTNFYQRDADGEAKPYLSLKFASEQIPELPLPRPKFEIFVYSPRVEADHLRFGAVARGGLRWSDRLQDFRTEVLGLVKAQTVKNSVIVPTGSKGGFVVKRPPAARDELMTEVLACYRQFICGMLDITDNRSGGDVVPPKDVVRHDGDDTYLVVAADKGTATFSDTANGIAAEYDFWLGDAFASGGSVGYDHKAMGITARGAWESVKYHFRTLGVDIQNEPFTAVGVGDMSGDVFGNGMLLSKHTRLVAAFDHRHIFIDPDPDEAVGWGERKRMFDLPRSSWADYDTSLISAGGGVWPRTAKSITITPQMRAALSIPDEVTTLTPDALINAILRSPVDLLWNGGIGTYVKSSAETNADAGDKANDGLRVNGDELRCRVVGEGGNLGLTQLGRVQFALAGGLVNTDFIDNSAGVDTSDHEVNIKILLDRVVRDGDMTGKQRDKLLMDMTDEVGDLVLRDNYHQNVVLGASVAQALSMLHVHARYMKRLERDGLLNRDLEFLPGGKTLAERRAAGTGLTLPEFSVLLAYTKMALADEVLASDLPDDPYLRHVLETYFPTPLRQKFAANMEDHPLRREIITTGVVNDMVNRSGTTFAFRMNEEIGASASDIARAYLVARNVFDMPSFWEAVENLDHAVSAQVQLSLLLEGRKLTERAARWLLHNRRPPFDIERTISFFADGVLDVAPHLSKLLVGRDLAAFEERRDGFVTAGVPEELAERTAGMVPAYSTFDLVEIAQQTGRSVQEAAEVYFYLADRLELSRLRERIIALPRDDRWNTMARSALRDDIYSAHAALTRDVMLVADGTPEDRMAVWSEKNAAATARTIQTLGEIWESDTFSVATLSVALRAMRQLVAASTLPEG
ncbi:MAG TPA: NAD-glutamate dehydrogenase [Streptosporangiaceae bacterium]|jgi:glutamate dehydrogenase